MNYTKENLRLYHWVEFLIWFLILCIVVIGVKHSNYKHRKELASYQIFLQDVDGLIVGSPVKYMGVQIGYIQKIKILSNEVYIKFVLTQKELKLPQGVIATVESSGMGGSKSLELYPPTQESINSRKLISIKDTNRLGDTIWRLDEMFNKIGSITARLSFFAKETGVVSSSTQHVDTKNIGENLKIFDEKLEQYNDERKMIKNKIKELKDE